MKSLLNSITNSSTMLDGYRFDREQFRASHVWARSLLSGAISCGLTVIGVYTGYLASDGQFASALGTQAVNFKLAAGAVLCSLLGYSLRDLFHSITNDVRTEVRVARANSWLIKGTASTTDFSNHIRMQQTPLSMVRFVEMVGGIRIYAIGKHPGTKSPILIDAMLFDEDYPAMATYYTHETDIRSALHEACAEWSDTVASDLGIELTSVVTAAASEPTPQPPLADMELPDNFDSKLLEGLDAEDAKTFGRASAPAPRSRGEALRAVANVPAEAVTH
jgi:hypothetical protein